MALPSSEGPQPLVAGLPRLLHGVPSPPRQPGQQPLAGGVDTTAAPLSSFGAHPLAEREAVFDVLERHVGVAFATHKAQQHRKSVLPALVSGEHHGTRRTHDLARPLRPDIVERSLLATGFGLRKIVIGAG